MNPYSTPESELENPRGPVPQKIRTVLLLIAISAIASLLNMYFYSKIVDGLPLTDPFNIGINVFWLCVLIWLAKGLVRDRENLKNVFLFLAILLGFFAVYDQQSFLTVFSSLVEAVCFIGSYFLLRSESLKSWFAK